MPLAARFQFASALLACAVAATARAESFSYNLDAELSALADDLAPGLARLAAEENTAGFVLQTAAGESCPRLVPAVLDRALRQRLLTAGVPLHQTQDDTPDIRLDPEAANAWLGKHALAGAFHVALDVEPAALTARVLVQFATQGEPRWSAVIVRRAIPPELAQFLTRLVGAPAPEEGALHELTPPLTATLAAIETVGRDAEGTLLAGFTDHGRAVLIRDDGTALKLLDEAAVQPDRYPYTRLAARRVRIVHVDRALTRGDAARFSGPIVLIQTALGYFVFAIDDGRRLVKLAPNVLRRPPGNDQIFDVERAGGEPPVLLTARPGAPEGTWLVAAGETTRVAINARLLVRRQPAAALAAIVEPAGSIIATDGRTTFEMPVCGGDAMAAADLDGDGSSELIVSDCVIARYPDRIHVLARAAKLGWRVLYRSQAIAGSVRAILPAGGRDAGRILIVSEQRGEGGIRQSWHAVSLADVLRGAAP